MKPHIDLAYLRPLKRQCAENLLDTYVDKTGKLDIRRFKNAIIRPMGQVPGIEPATNRLIDDCDYYAQIAPEDNAEAPTVIPGKVLYAGYLRASWGHFLVNSTARLWALYKNRDDYDKIVFFNEDGTDNMPQGNFKEFLELAGIIDRVVVLPDGLHKFDELVVPDIALEARCHCSEEFMMPFQYVTDKVLASSASSQATQSGAKGILLARSRWNGNDRMQINIEWMERLFTSKGYKAVYPENTSLSELITAMHNAPETVTFSGSTAHNILFSPDSHAVIVERCGAANAYQMAIALMCKGLSEFVDAFYQPLLTSSTDNLTIYGQTACLKSFAESKGFDLLPLNGNAVNEFKQYLKVYRRHYGYAPGLNDWETDQLPAIAEAFFDSRPRYSKAIERRIPITWHDLLSPRVVFHFLQDTIRSIRYKSRK